MIANNIDTIKAYIPAVKEADISQFLPQIESANQYIAYEILGTNLYNTLDSTPEAHPVAYAYVEKIICHKAFLITVPFIDVVLTQSSFAVYSSTTKAPASRARVDALLAASREVVSQTMTILVDHLLENLDNFHEWTTSSQYLRTTNAYIYTNTQLAEFTQKPQLNYHEWRNRQANTQIITQQTIEPVISPELSQQIIHQLRENTLSEANQKILPQLRFALGALLFGDHELATAFLAKAKTTILNNIDQYPAYQTSQVYQNELAIKAKMEALEISDDSKIFPLGI